MIPVRFAIGQLCECMFADSECPILAMLIPTEVSIKAAKDKREQLRKTGGTTSDGFISLSVTKREDVYQGPHPDSRLMREEDELGDAEEGGRPLLASRNRRLTSSAEFADFTNASDRIALGKKSKKVEASKRRETMEEMIADASVSYPFSYCISLTCTAEKNKMTRAQNGKMNNYGGVVCRPRPLLQVLSLNLSTRLHLVS